MFFSDISVIKHTKIKENQNHIYIKPHPLLLKYIAHYTISFMNMNDKRAINEKISNLTLIPDSSGCIIYTYENNNFYSNLWGSTTKTVIVKDDFNLNSIRFFIEFMPGGLHAITGINQSELCDVQVQIEEVDELLSFSLMRAMEITNSIDDMISMVNMILLKAIEKNNKQHSVIDCSLHIIKATSGRITIKELSSKQYISERHLNRLFNEYIGLNAKMFSRLVRVNHSISILKNFNNKNCLNIAENLGYFDQAHFIHDFKEICGVSPKSFVKNMSDFYNEPFKY